jgi:hypothetical protein
MFGTLAYIAYFRDIIRRDPIAPNRWSWLVWSAATAVEAMTYEAVSSDLIKAVAFFVSAGSCVVITLTIWRRATWKKPDWSEMACIVASVVALILWLYFRLTLVAHIVMIIAVPIAFIPTWRDAWRRPEGERSIVILLRYESPAELPYAVVEFLCHGIMWIIVAVRLSERESRGVR